MIKISRSKIDLFLECPRCFYLDKKLGIVRPSGPGFSLNSAVDALLKSEFDILRKEKKPHELMDRYKIDAVPYHHPDLEIWRTNFKGITFLHQPTGLLITGAIDDVWINSKGELHIVDYKSTSTKEEISLESEYKQGYKRQMEIYQWLFKQNGFTVSDTGYFVFANALKTRDKFDSRLEFEMSIIAHKGDTSWVEPAIYDLAKCLESDDIPMSSDSCKFCNYYEKQKQYDEEQGENYEDDDSFPWEDIEVCFKNKHAARGDSSMYTYQSWIDSNKDTKCPGCGRGINELKAFYFESPDWTWTELCGRAGWMVACDVCKKQIDFWPEIMS